MIDRDRPLAFWDTPFLNKSAQRWSFCWCIPLPCRQQELEAQTEYIRAHKDLLPTNVMFFCYQEAVGRCLQVGLKPFKAILSSLTLVPSGMTTVTRRMWLRGQQMFGPGLVSSFYGSCCLGTVMTFWHILAMYLPSVQLPCSAWRNTCMSSRPPSHVRRLVVLGAPERHAAMRHPLW